MRLGITALITAMGVSYILEYGTQFFAGSDVKTFPEGLLGNLNRGVSGASASVHADSYLYDHDRIDAGPYLYCKPYEDGTCHACRQCG